ncbi:putative disease resistance protein RGA3 isoform X2 [Silene latifolia]
MGNTHELEGLSDEHSQSLFEMVAFQDGEKPPDLVEIGEKIVKKSSNVPLAIMVIGSLLYAQPIDKWQTFLTNGFNRFSKGMDEIMSILKISYDNLDPSLKSCFAYCAIFPKDFFISKELIINLWDAQGYIVPFHKDQSIDNAGEEHFSVLLQRCFFQDVKKNEWGDVESFKIHDLMHDLAQRVSGNDIWVINSSMPHPEYKVRHIFSINSISKATDAIDRSIVFNKSKIRTYLMFLTISIGKLLYEMPAFLLPNPNRQDGVSDELLTFEIPKNWGYLRALVLQNPNIRIPDTIGNLLHLRYLNLSHSRMKNLPDSIVKLYNLKTLDITYCEYLNGWPKEFSKLVNLTHLYWELCYELKCMPVGMSKLSHLRRLTEFVVEDESASGMQRVGQLKDLRALAMNLKGRIHIIFIENFKSADGYDWEGSCLEDAQHLNEVIINFHCPPPSLDHVAPLQNKEKGEKEEVVIEKMKPNPNLKSFILRYYSGEKIARWGRARDNWGSFLPNLVVIVVEYCERLQELPVLSKLRHLKSLHLTALKNLEYMEEEVTDSIGLELSGSRSLDATFFPSLKSLHLDTLENLKGWWRSGDSNKSHRQPAFPILSHLVIYSCPRLVSFPPCLSLPKLKLGGNCRRMRIRTAKVEL